MKILWMTNILSHFLWKFLQVGKYMISYHSCEPKRRKNNDKTPGNFYTLKNILLVSQKSFNLVRRPARLRSLNYDYTSYWIVCVICNQTELTKLIHVSKTQRGRLVRNSIDCKRMMANRVHLVNNWQDLIAFFERIKVVFAVFLMNYDYLRGRKIVSFLKKAIYWPWQFYLQVNVSLISENHCAKSDHSLRILSSC